MDLNKNILRNSGVKFMLSKKATKIDEIFTVDLKVTVKLTVKILSIFVAFSVNVNFIYP